MTDSPVFLTDLPASERLTVWAIRRLAGQATPQAAPQSTQPGRCMGRAVQSSSSSSRGRGASSGTAAGLFLPCFRREFLAVAQAFHEAMTDIAALEMPRLDIRSGSMLAVTETEYALLLATAAGQNEREAEMHAVLRHVLPFGGLRARMVSALATLGACLAGAGYWLSHHVARMPLSRMDEPGRGAMVAYPQALSLSRWQDIGLGGPAAPGLSPVNSYLADATRA
ncbi:hypothetical protein K2X14_07130 [Acetobacter sp. TBRC 12305]|uniref:Uncharacterized protein n=1 Tax=Acetobacter garciniae TaxID=2817435 RepID=A0A939HLF3_9PROT|nr:hypothetical protein [Acetobacter garciniae]MBO1324915.1 hypothetical protein [Acetobacter garciniae]MBX0344606.1 hypothetical protein [Acetobacter garciniae]